MRLTSGMIWAASRDAGNRSMRAAGRTYWSAVDYDAACEEFYRLLALYEPSQPAPAEAYADVEDEEPHPRWDEDQYLDDPRHGQARSLNRRYG